MDDPVVARLRDELCREPSVRLAFVFGSRARARQRPDSDVDVAVRAPGVDRLDLAGRLAIALGVEVDVIDLDDLGYPLLKEVVAHGVVVAERERGSAALFRSHALATLETDRPNFERMRDAFLRRLAAGQSW